MRLKYFSNHHLEAAEQHELFEEELEAMLLGMERTPEHLRGLLRSGALGTYGASTVLKKDLMTCLPFTSQMMVWPWRMR
jgi:hypothetical protein